MLPWPARGVQQPLEPDRVDLVRIDPQRVPAELGDDHRRPECGPQPGHVGLRAAPYVGRLVLSPDRLGQPGDRDELAGRQREYREQGAQPPGAEPDLRAVDKDLERAEEADRQRFGCHGHQSP
jgi:hypothetical protein